MKSSDVIAGVAAVGQQLQRAAAALECSGCCRHVARVMFRLVSSPPIIRQSVFLLGIYQQQRQQSQPRRVVTLHSLPR
jgi:hypothetical protein